MESNKIKEQNVLINTIVQKEYDECCVVGYLAGMPIKFLIDSGADANTVDKTNFDCLIGSNLRRNLLYSKKTGTDRPLKAYDVQDEIPVIASFVAELYISEDRPHLMEKFYVIPNARALLSRGTAIRYSVLQLGMEVLVQNRARSNTINLRLGEILAALNASEFPRFKVAPLY